MAKPSLNNASTGAVEPSFHSYLEIEIATIIFRYWVPVLTLFFGIPGNFLALLVTINKANRRISTCVYMSAIALTDNGLLLFVLIDKTLTALGIRANYQSKLALLYATWYNFGTCATSSGLFLAAMTFDRALAILFPLAAKSICTASKARRVVLGLFTCVAFLNIYIFFTMKPMESVDVGHDHGFWLVLNYPNPPWVEKIIVMYTLCCGTIIPFLLILFCNIVIIWRIKRASKNRSKMATGRAEQEVNIVHHLLRTTILVSAVYIISTLPTRAFNEVARLMDLKYLSSYRIQLHFFLYLLFGEIYHLNYAVNFYLYILGGGQKFRIDIKAVFKSCFSCLKLRK